MFAIATLSPSLPASPRLRATAEGDDMWMVWCRGLAMTALGLAGFLAWAAWMPVQQTLSGPGTLAVGTQDQPPLDRTARHAALNTAERRLMMMASSHERLAALAAHAPGLHFSDTVAAQAAAEGAAGERLLATQHALFLYQSAQMQRVDWPAKLAELEQQQWALQTRIAALRDPGQEPADAPQLPAQLRVEARLVADAEARPEAGQSADLELPGQGLRSTRLKGQVLMVADEKLRDGRSGRAYWQVQLLVPAAEVQRLAGQGIGLSAGQPFEVHVPLARHSMLSYLVKPLASKA